MSTHPKELPDPANGAWHLDKRIPIALIFTLIVQSAGLVWWVSNIVHRLETAVETNTRQDARLNSVEAATNNQAVANATMTAQITAVRESLIELKSAQAETLRLLRDQAGNP